MFNGKGRVTKADPRELNTILGAGSVIEGKISIDNSVRVEGRIVGEIRSTGTLTVGAHGEIEGDVNAVHVIIGGKVKGGVRATEAVILEANGVLMGDVCTSRLTIDEGAMFEGRCTMLEGDRNVPRRSNGQAVAEEAAAEAEGGRAAGS